MAAQTQAGTCGLIDGFGRRVTYLRLSVTDRCDLRCVYCMSEDMSFRSRRDILSLEELARLARLFIARGVDTLRITGGEPLVRQGILDLFQALSEPLRTGALRELTLTTNGTQLARFAEDLARAGVRRINVSLDTLDPERFRTLTRGGSLAKVLDGIAAARAAGLRVKLNVVALKDGTEHEIHDLIAFAHERDMALSLIETMPLGDIGADRLDQYLPLDALRRQIERRWTLVDIPMRTGGPARYARIAETGGLIGFITPHTHNFCADCNRVRVTASGTLHTCLGQEDATDLRAMLRAGGTDDDIFCIIDQALGRKPKGHDFVLRRGAPSQITRTMSETGG
ncbi:GTP 3',8-cyclase MoaA [Methylobacterium sp. J-048]|uniref:GTP 3',8-cyclase MoaA n=1 Tax=Methylobacterium sp. J-048 TaxID=2836635 RepID=UPI001FBAE6D0|nr:GTP 3',8-cyclase MoaA [Methylobacterium sp. J-048]MCJ2059028.1 GTP 3',8-cyclase MoaA [Methylobacterium sp. J-048]